MTLYHESHYRYADNASLTTGQENFRYEHIDARIDALEDHMADVVSNPHHIVSVTGAIRFPIGWFAAGTVATGHANFAAARIPIAMTAATAGVHVDTASSSGVITVDILKSSDNGGTWTTLFSTKITVDAGERDSATAATPCVFGTTSLAAGDFVRPNIDGAGTAASAITIDLQGTYTASMTGTGV